MGKKITESFQWSMFPRQHVSFLYEEVLLWVVFEESNSFVIAVLSGEVLPGFNSHNAVCYACMQLCTRRFSRFCPLEPSLLDARLLESSRILLSRDF